MLGFQHFSQGVMSMRRILGDDDGNNEEAKENQRGRATIPLSPPLLSRPYLWSFLGYLKSDRVEMVRWMRKLTAKPPPPPPPTATRPSPPPSVLKSTLKNEEIDKHKDDKLLRLPSPPSPSSSAISNAPPPPKMDTFKYMWGQGHKISRLEMTEEEDDEGTTLKKKKKEKDENCALHLTMFRRRRSLTPSTSSSQPSMSLSSSSSTSSSLPPVFRNFTYTHNRSQFRHHCCFGQSIEKLYRQSVFVPVGRGFVTLDCFRIYEAAAAGAIPIVVGERDELVKAFLNLEGNYYSSGIKVRKTTDLFNFKNGNRINGLDDNNRHRDAIIGRNDSFYRRPTRDAETDWWQWQRFGFTDLSSSVTATIATAESSQSQNPIDSPPPFHFLTLLPPFVYAETWERATDVVKAMLGGENELARKEEEDSSSSSRSALDRNPILRHRQLLVTFWFMDQYEMYQKRIVDGRDD